jgi:hypothetical protein
MDAIIDAIVEEWGTIVKIFGVMAVVAILFLRLWGAVFPAPEQKTPPGEFPANMGPINGAASITANATPTVTPTPAPRYPDWPGVSIDYDKNVVYMDVNKYYENGGTDIVVTDTQYNSGPYMPIYAKLTDGNRTYEWLENQGGFDPVHGLVAAVFVDHPLQDQIDLFNARRLM